MKIPKKILIIKLGAIGDLLMATPSIELIRQTYPQSEISLLVGQWAKDIVLNNPNLDKVIVIDENIFWKKRLLDLIKLFWSLKKQNYDLVYNMHWSIYFNLFVYLLNVSQRIGFDRKGEGIFLTRKIFFTEGEKGPHMVDQYLHLVSDEYTASIRQMKIYLKDEENIEAENWLKKRNLEPKKIYIGIAPGGGTNPKMTMVTRRWPIEYFVKLIELIHEKRDITILIFGGIADEELGKKIIAQVVHKNKVVNLAGVFNLRQSSAILKFCKVLICNDSALLHLSAAVDVPTVSIFGPTVPYDKVPYGRNHQYLFKGLSCSPCYLYGRYPKCLHLSCLKQIIPEEVYNKINILE